jgi:hypothetical protein
LVIPFTRWIISILKKLLSIIIRAADINWYISWYSSEDLERIEQFVTQIGILNSKVRLLRT